MTPPFPPELVNQVASYLRDDKQALSAASTVSRTWLASFRGRLFENVRVKHKRNKDFTRFASFLENSPPIRRLIVRLRMRGRINVSTLSKTLSLLPSLSTLSFKGWFELAESIDLTLPPFRLDQLLIDVVTEEDEDEDDEQDNDTDDTDENGGIDEDETGLGDGVNPHGGDDHAVAWGWGATPEQLLAHSDRWSRGRRDAKILFDVLRLFSYTRELYIDYYWNHYVWFITASELEEMIPTPGILTAESFCFSHLEPASAMFAFFYRLLRPQALSSIATKLDWYPCVNEFRTLIREARDLTSLAFAVGERCKCHLPIVTPLLTL